MPSLFAYSNTTPRSQSLPDNSQNVAPTGPYVRRGSATLEALTRGLRKKSGVELVLEGKDDFIHTYSTFDKIKGHVLLNFEKDTLIGDMIIAFEGQSQTYVEKIAAASPTTGRTTGKHTFLRMLQPISPESLPENMLAKANVTYTIPFTFVVPDRLLPYICSHKVDHDEVKQEHLRLPPSIGEPMLSGEGNVLMDDMAPEMSKIIYCIRAKVGKASTATGRLVDIEEKVARIRLVPAQEEQPPLSVSEESVSYVLRKEKNVRKGVFKIGKKLGRLTAEATQPRSLRLPALTNTSRGPVTTMASVTLRFDPASEQEQPPQMGNLSTKLRVYTFFGAAAYRKIPEISQHDNWSTLHGVYPDSINLSSRNIGSVTWTKHDPENRKKSVASSSSDDAGLSRRASTFSNESESSSSSSASIPAASSAYDSSLPFYTAKVLVPVSLPQRASSEDDEGARRPSSPKTKSPLNRVSKNVLFIPTFNACIISRNYALELGLSFSPVNSQGNASNALTSSSVTLRTPIQISQEGSSLPPVDEQDGTPLDLALIEGTDEYDEAMARHLDQELNFTNPFRSGNEPEAIPEYEEVQTIFPPGVGRHASIAVPPSAAAANREQPPEYYSPFRTSVSGPSAATAAAAASGSGGLGRRVSNLIRLRP